MDKGAVQGAPSKNLPMQKFVAERTADPSGYARDDKVPCFVILSGAAPFAAESKDLLPHRDETRPEK
jgi:hypothetical protein